MLFFFFQAEDGIRDRNVTGVQTCALPISKSWTPGTNGAVTADVVRADINSDADFEKYRGKLARKIVLTQPLRDVRMLEGIIVQRWTDALLKESESTPSAPP